MAANGTDMEYCTNVITTDNNEKQDISTDEYDNSSDESSDEEDNDDSDEDFPVLVRIIMCLNFNQEYINLSI